MKSYKKLMLALCAATFGCTGAQAVGWPSAWEGVMLQGFYWDSYQSETKWTNLEAKADEYSEYFKLIWVPNSGRSTGGLGYHPVYWFTNHNSDMGSEKELLSMIAAYKERGTGIIADLVINHRSGTSNWTNFPTEKWNGVTYSIGADGICCDDEVASQAGQTKPTGAYDTGDKYDSARDLDHTNANVQFNCKNYEKCLLEKYGYAGFRVDYAKGYGGQYLKMYNQYANPTYCVAEYWDGSYDALAAWIESAGRESAAFDFAFKYAVNKAFSTNNMTYLVWKANGVTPQPAGLIHYGYQQFAVTFVDNHDTYRDSNKFSGNVLAANAFMLCSPGTPCVFLPHWNSYSAEIGAMIKVRNAVGVSNTSAVNVIRTDATCYLAEVTGSKGKLVVKIGSADVTPTGYTSADIKASGNGYCIWSKVSTGTVTPDPTPTMPSNLYVMGDLAQGHWQTNVALPMTKSGTTYEITDVDLQANTNETYAYFAFVTSVGTTGNSSEWDAIINTTDRYGAQSKDQKINPGSTNTVVKYDGGGNASGCYSWGITPGHYDISIDFNTMKMTIKTTTGIEAVDSDFDEVPEYYTLQGIRVDSPAQGFYIERRGRQVRKVYIR